MKLIRFGNETLNVDEIYRVSHRECYDANTDEYYLYAEIYIKNEKEPVVFSKESRSHDEPYDSFMNFLDGDSIDQI